MYNLCRLAEHLEAVLDRSEGLVERTTGRGTKDQLGVELPAGRDVPLLLNLLVNQGAVVLEVGTQAFGGESGPDCEC